MQKYHVLFYALLACVIGPTKCQSGTYVPATQTCDRETRNWPERIFDGNATFVKDINAGENWILAIGEYTIFDIKYKRGYYYIVKQSNTDQTVLFERIKVNPALGNAIRTETLYTPHKAGFLIEFTDGFALALVGSDEVILFNIDELQNEHVENIEVRCQSLATRIAPFHIYPQKAASLPIYGLRSQDEISTQNVRYTFWNITQSTCQLTVQEFPDMFFDKLEPVLQGWIRTFDDHRNTPCILHTYNKIHIYKNIHTQTERQTIDFNGAPIKSVEVYHDIKEYTYILAQNVEDEIRMYKMILSNDRWTWPGPMKQVIFKDWQSRPYGVYTLFFNYESHILIVRPHYVYVPRENADCYTCPEDSKPLDNTLRHTWCMREQATIASQLSTTATTAAIQPTATPAVPTTLPVTTITEAMEITMHQSTNTTTIPTTATAPPGTTKQETKTTTTPIPTATIAPPKAENRNTNNARRYTTPRPIMLPLLFFIFLVFQTQIGTQSTHN